MNPLLLAVISLSLTTVLIGVVVFYLAYLRPKDVKKSRQQSEMFESLKDNVRKIVHQQSELSHSQTISINRLSDRIGECEKRIEESYDLVHEKPFETESGAREKTATVASPEELCRFYNALQEGDSNPRWNDEGLNLKFVFLENAVDVFQNPQLDLHLKEFERGTYVLVQNQWLVPRYKLSLSDTRLKEFGHLFEFDAAEMRAGIVKEIRRPAQVSLVSDEKYRLTRKGILSIEHRSD